MYVTRPLSLLLKSPELLSARPEGPNSGFLTIQDEESETYSCFGLCKNRSLNELPFPQNKELVVQYTQSDDSTLNPLFLIPVLNQPLSANLYYAIDPHGKRIGEAVTCSSEDDKVTCCFCRCVKDMKPRPLDPRNIYQQIEIVPYETACSSGGYFLAKSVATDGFPPYFLRQKGWTIYTKTPEGHFKLDEARGVDSSLRARLPQHDSSYPVLVGKWYCPFVFVKEETLRDQVKGAMYYEVTLEQRWEHIFSFHKNVSGYQGKSVVIDALVEKEEFVVHSEYKGKQSDKNVSDEVVWFTGVGSEGGKSTVGLRQEVVERMKWEQERFGWVGGEERQVKINRTEEFKESGEWAELKCYVLVERFSFKRMCGTPVMACDFKHCHQLKIKWN